MPVPSPNRPTMSAKTHLFVRMMRKAGVFVNLEPKLVASGADTTEVLITCFDPNRFPDKWDHWRNLGGQCRCCVPVPFPGGSLVIPAHSPLAVTTSGHRADGVLLDMLDMAVHELGARRIRALVHYPCLAVKHSGLSDLEVLELNIAAKDRLRDRYPGFDIGLLVHVDYIGHRAQNNLMNTYKFDRSNFNIWKESQPGRVYMAQAA